MPPGIPEGAMCVQRFDDSLNSAIHITYRILLRSSSMPEPRDPLLKVLAIISLTEGTVSLSLEGLLVSSTKEDAGGNLSFGFSPPKQQR